MKSKDDINLLEAYESVAQTGKSSINPMIDSMLKDKNLSDFLRQWHVNVHVGTKNKTTTHDEVINIVDSFLEKLKDYMIPKVMNPNKRVVETLPERPGEPPVYRN